ncbi:hypothetical protein LTR36_004008 [Oleoguttula mirabilis]|uniref:BTB domain-containing protein n=1 Tax=Oleoguttula mirabilis TaxID=1507867 RepID=A0AAV9JI26_9PEZI|nr:hypothetical protein LTR36_004008 [Oleoguttula mirabilis]
MADDSIIDKASTMQHLEEPLLGGVERAYTTGDYADAIVTCKGKTWKVHRLVLCSHSEFFRKAWGGEFKEAKERAIELPDDEPRTVEAMLSYLYKRDYDAQSGGSGEEDIASIVLDARVFIIADKYFILKLKDLAAIKLQERAKAEWKSPAFANAISEVYTASPAEDRTLHDIVIETVKEHAVELFQDEEAHASFHAVVDNVGDFAADLLKALGREHSKTAKEKKKATTYKCPYCATKFSLDRPPPYSGSNFSCPCCRNYINTPLWWSDYGVLDE